MVKSCTIWNDNQYTDNYRLGFDFEDDKKPDKIVLSNRDDDRGYDNPVRWEFEIVDKKYIDDADANLQRQITENATHIADHETRISHNEHELADHETRITNNETNISNNASNIASNQGMITVLQGDVANLTSQVTNNTNNITHNGARITALEARPDPGHQYIDRTFISEVGTDWAYCHTYIDYLSDDHVTMTTTVDYQCLNDLMLNVPFESISPFDWDGGTGAGIHGTKSYPYKGKLPDYTSMQKVVVGWVNKMSASGNEFDTLNNNNVSVTSSTYQYTSGGSPVTTVPAVQINTMVSAKQTGRIVIKFDFNMVNRH